MTTVFTKNGTAFVPSSEANLDIHKVLPGGNYLIKQMPMNGPLYFDRIDSFPALGKVYGNSTSNAGRIMNTFESRSGSTGVLLNGEKGSGKTMLAKSLALMGEARGYPTIVINQPWCGDAFNQLMQSLEQPSIILFDEFEKVYDREQQAAMLTLLDGVFPSKKMFVLTCNDKYRVDSHMRNRPGRIFYMLDFSGLDADFIREYCIDNLNDQQYVETVVRVGSIFDQFNFDMLKALVEEMNRYNESPAEALKMLNAKPSADGGGQFTTTITYQGYQITELENRSLEWNNGSPLACAELDVSFRYNKHKARNTLAGTPELALTDEEEDDYDWNELCFTQENLVALDADKGTFTYRHANGDSVVFTRKKAKAFNYADYVL